MKMPMLAASTAVLLALTGCAEQRNSPSQPTDVVEQEVDRPDCDVEDFLNKETDCGFAPKSSARPSPRATARPRTATSARPRPAQTRKADAPRRQDAPAPRRTRK